MSVTIMAAVFAANMPELKTDDGKTVPDSTAKFVLLALADHASEDGENAYIGVKRICMKTNLSTSTVCNALNALRTNGIIELVGKSKAETNNYTINVERLQSLKFQPLESHNSSRQNPAISATEIKPSVNHQNNHTNNLKTDEVQGSYNTAYQRGEQERPDKIAAMLDLERNAPGAVRMRKVDELLSLWSVAFLVKTTNKRWRAFAEYAIDMQDKQGWEPKKFIEWVKRQEGYPTYWSQQRMEENYPKAFTEPTEPDWRDRSHAL